MTDDTATRPRALIIGCGIAGPVLAVALQQAGIIPVIHEARPRPDDEAGAFLNLAPNGIEALRLLGLDGTVVDAGTRTTRIEFYNHRGRRLATDPTTTLLLKRGALTRALREAAAERGVAVESGKRLAEVTTTAQGTVAARFADGTRTEGDLLVGCDGIRSAVRGGVLPGAPAPRSTGLVDSGGFSECPGLAPSGGVFRMTFGRRAFFGYQVLESGEVYWFHNSEPPAGAAAGELTSWDDNRWKDRLLELHQGDHEPIEEIIRSTRGPIGRWPVLDMPDLATWHDGPVGLIGDAAHAMSPSAGQGASMAMEDAVVLARLLRDHADADTAFAELERGRKPRVDATVRRARRNGDQKAPSSAAGRALRDLALPVFLRAGIRAGATLHSWTDDPNPSTAANLDR
ncbi:MAG: FAD-binding monooxygenase [Pseudonocardiaceae bacterium]|nr:FAD-binding monooxygenase [Pseudonocardiaceae bacterium]